MLIGRHEATDASGQGVLDLEGYQQIEAKAAGQTDLYLADCTLTFAAKYESIKGPGTKYRPLGKVTMFEGYPPGGSHGSTR